MSDTQPEVIQRFADELAYNIVGSLQRLNLDLSSQRGYGSTREERAGLFEFTQQRINESIAQQRKTLAPVQSVELAPCPNSSEKGMLSIRLTDGTRHRYVLRACATLID
ncbi:MULTISPECIES: hypothetical protein [unclassified Cupriavidus]|uniref:hypothetical protein n=1 Tax=unclassified Cupriavidus TaxID=2640874 RepID=UPI001C001610|nr:MULTISPECIES: hypothetical protein [unclassified Cupriavidus]MCA3187905.1 hypothetical protein [Cupriavidus sp.]MCA3189452.1 hypothetical protein [Cupriavidus sp.]MCA3195532.1 hypothetical protein [Cupriavidus sp.]MCA3201087.1 hypothetical protein [Cupriavidus sp.]MCA3207899.1 hypothetical protein [Cupriavidus sp.]